MNSERGLPKTTLPFRTTLSEQAVFVELERFHREAAACPSGIVKRQVNVRLCALRIDGRRPAKYIGFVDLEKGYPTVGARRT